MEEAWLGRIAGIRVWLAEVDIPSGITSLAIDDLSALGVTSSTSALLPMPDPAELAGKELALTPDEDCPDCGSKEPVLAEAEVLQLADALLAGAVLTPSPIGISQITLRPTPSTGSSSVEATWASCRNLPTTTYLRSNQT